MNAQGHKHNCANPAPIMRANRLKQRGATRQKPYAFDIPQQTANGDGNLQQNQCDRMKPAPQCGVTWPPKQTAQHQCGMADETQLAEQSSAMAQNANAVTQITYHHPLGDVVLATTTRKLRDEFGTIVTITLPCISLLEGA